MPTLGISSKINKRGGSNNHVLRWENSSKMNKRGGSNKACTYVSKKLRKFSQKEQGEKDEIAMIEQRMASRQNQFQGELSEIQSKKDMVESHITQVVDKGAKDKHHMVSGRYGFTYLLLNTIHGYLFYKTILFRD